MNRLSLSATALAGLAMVGTACTQGQAQESHTLVVAVTSTPDGLDPNVHFSIGANQAEHHLYYPLFAYSQKANETGLNAPDYDTSKWKGVLADSYDLSSDGNTLTIHLRKGVMSVAGNELTAEDMKWTWDRDFAIPGEGQFQIQTVLGITQPSWRVVDKYTFEVKTPKRNAILPYEMAMQKFGIAFDSTVAKQHVTADDPWATNWLATHAAGFGPYYLESYTPGTSVVLTANPNWFQGKPYFDKVELREVPSAANRSLLVQSGAVDVALDIPPRELNNLKKSSNVKIWSTPGNLVTRVGFNLNTKPFDDIRFRQALLYATPVDAILKTVYFGFGTALKSPLPATWPGYDPSFWNYTYDLDKAKELLKDSGQTSYKMTLAYDSSSQVHADFLTIMKSSFEQIGLDVELQGLPDATYFGSVSRGEYPQFIYENFPIIPDAGYGFMIAYPCKAPFNPEHYCNPKVDELLDKAVQTLDNDARIALYKQVQQLIVGDAPEIWIAMPGWHAVTKPDLRGMNWNADNAPSWYELFY
jgi:peptide/nickel transport system substrate-binding protein